MSTNFADALVAAARQSVLRGLNHGTTGNLSVRTPTGFLITPSGAACDAIGAGDLVPIALDGEPAEGDPRPSSEWRLHRDLYRARPGIGAVLHAHPVFSTTLACLRIDLPAVHYMLAVTGGAVVRCAPYATFGSPALSAAAVAAMGEGRACLLANHGLVAAGTDPAQALRVAVEVEAVAELYWRALQVGKPVLLEAAEMAEVLKRVRGYAGLE